MGCMLTCREATPRFAPSAVRRVTQIFEDPQFYIDGETTLGLQVSELAS